MRNGRADGGRGSLGRQFLAEMRVGLLQLPYLALGTPAQIAVPGIPEIRVGDRLEAACSIEPCGAFVGDALVLDEPVLARQPNGLFVETLGLQFSAFEACDLGGDQRRATPKVLGTVLRPLF